MASSLVQSMRLPLRGDLRIITRSSEDHTVLSVWEKKNVITYAGTEALVELMAPNTALGASIQQENQIKSMRFGTDNTTPQRTDTDLVNEAVVGDPVRVEFLDANRIIGASGTVEFTATLDSATGNGVTYREAGLFTRGTADDPQTTTGVSMFSRQIFPDQPKNSSIELEFRWRITFTV